MKDRFARLKSAVIPEKEKGDVVGQSIMTIRNVSMAFGGLAVLKGVSFSVRQGDIVVIIGPNGAGKTTLLKIISGLLSPTKGEIWFKQQRLSRIAPHRIASLGVTQVFQDIQVFPNMSVLENVMVGCHLRTRAGFMSTGLRLPHAKADEHSILEIAMSKLSLVGLEQKASARPDSLSWGQLKLVGLARALATGSELLLLDEPYGGLLADEVERLNRLLLDLQRQEITILMVEHLTDIIMEVANHVIVLDYGEKIAEGTPTEIQNNKQVIDAYLGSEHLEGERG